MLRDSRPGFRARTGLPLTPLIRPTHSDTCGLPQSVLADVSIATGYATIGLMLAGRLVFQFLGWGVAAATTPLVMAVTGGAFFAFSLFGSPETATLGVYAGAVTQARAPQTPQLCSPGLGC